MLTIKIIRKPSEWLKNLRNGFGAVLINHYLPMYRDRKVIERKIMHKLTSTFLLIICLSSFAFAEVRMNSLGDYFHYLVPDVETDIEVFPTHLNFLEQRNIMLTAGDKYPSKKIGLNVYPFLGKISYGMKTGFASGEYPYRREYYPVIFFDDIYHFDPGIIITEPKGYKGYLSDSYKIGNRSGFYIKNFLSLKIRNDFHIGIKFNWIKNWLTEDKYMIKIFHLMDMIIIIERIQNIEI